MTIFMSFGFSYSEWCVVNGVKDWDLKLIYVSLQILASQKVIYTIQISFRMTKFRNDILVPNLYIQNFVIWLTDTNIRKTKILKSLRVNRHFTWVCLCFVNLNWYGVMIDHTVLDLLWQAYPRHFFSCFHSLRNMFPLPPNNRFIAYLRLLKYL